MATRSAIGYVDDSGKIQSVYCQYDGYPSHVGAVLYTFYNNLGVIKPLIEKGDISCILDLRDTLETNFHLPSNPIHYHAWRGGDWDWVKPKTHTHIDTALSFYAGHCVEYFYLFEAGKWNFCRYMDQWLKFSDLEQILTTNRDVIDGGGLDAYCQSLKESVEIAKQS